MYEMYARCMKSVRLMHLVHSVVRFIHPPVKRLSDSVFWLNFATGKSNKKL